MIGLYTVKNLQWTMRMFCIQAPVTPPSTQEQVTDKETGETKTVTKKGRLEKDDYIRECMTWLYNPQPPKKLKKRKPEPSPKKSVKKKKADSDDEDDLPLTDLKKPPTEKQLKKKIHMLCDSDYFKSDLILNKILSFKKYFLVKGADFNQITIKIICEQVYDSFPSYRENLISRKSTIKTIIKDYIASN